MLTATSELISINPATDAEIERFDVLDEAALDTILDQAVEAARDWRGVTLEGRSRRLAAVAAQLRLDAEELAQTITAEMGKPLAEARAEVEKCAGACDYFAAEAPAMLAQEAAPSDSPLSRIEFDPLGVVLAGMPWNYPLWQVIRCAAPALMAGNAVVLKHAANTTRCGLLLERTMIRAGVPQGLFRMLLVPVAGVAGLIADRRIAGVSLTGSTAAGREVGAQAGRHLKPAVLELGGSDAFVVLADADIDAAARWAARSRFQNAGQTCIAAKRFIVVETVADRFTDQLIERCRALRVGDPTEADTDIGPLARVATRERIEQQIQQSVAVGARLACGGQRPDGPGNYVTPAVLVDCPPESVAFREETFGPLAAVTTVADDEAAVARANDTDFALGGNVFSGDAEHALAVARRMRSGGVFINGMTHSDARLPFGGVGDSGFGRELHRFGVHAFVNVRTVWIAAESEQPH